LPPIEGCDERERGHIGRTGRPYTRVVTEPRIRLARSDVGEEEVEAIREVLASGFLTNGPRTKAFEAAFAARHRTAHGVAFANGTVALQALYLAAGIGPGDEVIVPSMTFISTATSVLHVGATPVFADVDPETYDLDAADVARRVTSRTKAIVAVHYGGQAADMDENITTGEGGMVLTDDDDLADALRLLRNHGQSALYQHTVLGYNWRITEMQAAMGVVQIGRLDGILARKQANAERMAQLLADVPGVQPPVVRPDRDHVYMLYTTLLDPVIDRDAVLKRLLDMGIEARVYFPPAHRQPVFAATGGAATALPVTDELARRMLSLPFHSRLTSDELADVASCLREAIQAG
jgi:perosamine synthetase